MGDVFGTLSRCGRVCFLCVHVLCALCRVEEGWLGWGGQGRAAGGQGEEPS